MTYEEQQLLRNKELTVQIFRWSTLSVVLIISIIVVCMWGCPKYSVYQQTMTGEAELRRATQNRQIAVQEAQAKMEAAKSLAEADVIRAQGVARANQIIGKSLENNDAYLHWLWIDNLDKNPQAVIYVPTEAGLPIFGRGSVLHPKK